jgi:hypothetical protein
MFIIPMRPLTALRLAIPALILSLACGCSSNNQGKIEATKWNSLAGTVKGQSIPAGALQLAFGGNGEMIYTINDAASGSRRALRGTYSLQMGDLITLHLNEELAGKKTHVETVAIEGDRLTMTDLDGTALTFAKVR